MEKCHGWKVGDGHSIELVWRSGRWVIAYDLEEHEAPVIGKAMLCDFSGGEGDFAEGLDGVGVELFKVSRGSLALTRMKKRMWEVVFGTSVF